MDEVSKKMLAEIVEKKKKNLDLTVDEKGFLKARRSYLTEAECKEFGLEVDKTEKVSETVSEEEKEEAVETAEEVEVEATREDLEKLTMQELRDVCKDNGLSDEGRSKKVLIDRILG